MKKNGSVKCDAFNEHPGAIREAKKGLLSWEQTQKISELFKAFGDPTRIKILLALSKSELCVCDIAAVVEMGQSAVSHQLRILRNARLIKFRKNGQNAYYSLNDKHVSALLYQGIGHVQHTKIITGVK